MYERVPQRLRSRVSGAITAGCELALPVGGLVAGLLVESVGVDGALLALGGVYLLATVSPMVFPVWRTMDGRPSEVARGGAPAAEVKADVSRE